MDDSFRLEPMTMGQLLDRAFRLFRAHFWVLIGIAAAVQIFSLILQLGIQAFVLSRTIAFNPNNPEDIIANPALVVGAAAGGLLVFVVTIVVSLLTSAALARAIGNAYLGEKLGVMDAFRAVTPHLRQLFGYMLVAFGLGLALGIWLIVPCVGWFTGPGMLLSFSVVGSIGIPVLVLENRGGWESITRAWSLIRRRYWWVMGFFLLVSLLTAIVTIGPSFLVSLISQSTLPAFPSFGQQMTVTSIQTVITALLNVIILPFSTIAYILMYFDLRITTEGFDLAVDAAEGEPGMTPSQLLRLQVPEAPGLEVKGVDMQNFFLATLLAFALYAVLAGIGLGMGAVLGV